MRAARMLSQLESVSKTCTPFFVSSLPIARETLFAPTMRKPLGGGSATPSHRASGRDVALCNTTVPKITLKVRGTKICASVAPDCSNLMAKSADTAAATIPRGEIQDRRVFSCQVSVLPMADSQTDKGRAINCITPSRTSGNQPKAINSSRVNRAARMINSPEINNTVRCSLKLRISPMRMSF